MHVGGLLSPVVQGGFSVLGLRVVVSVVFPVPFPVPVHVLAVCPCPCILWEFRSVDSVVPVAFFAVVVGVVFVPLVPLFFCLFICAVVIYVGVCGIIIFMMLGCQGPTVFGLVLAC